MERKAKYTTNAPKPVRTTRELCEDAARLCKKLEAILDETTTRPDCIISIDYHTVKKLFRIHVSDVTMLYPVKECSTEQSGSNCFPRRYSIVRNGVEIFSLHTDEIDYDQVSK